LRLAAEDADIGFCNRKDRAGADEVVDLITHGESGMAHGRRAQAWQEDVSNTAHTQAFIASAFDQFGAVDILVNNAGLERRANSWELGEQDYDLVVSVNLKDVFFISQAVARRWIDTKRRGKSLTSLRFTTNCRCRTSPDFATDPSSGLHVPKGGYR
jgi:glucose 1-dehydrogenase